MNLPPPEIHSCATDDQSTILLTHYRGGKKGPVMVVHGGSAASTMFAIPTIKKNFARYLCDNGYDVWLLDWRASIHLPLQLFTFDEVAKYDFPAAVKFILEKTGARSIQAVVHCIGSIAFFMSVAAGHIPAGQVRCIAASQVALHPHVGSVMKWKARIRLAAQLAKRGITEVSPEADPMYPIFSTALGLWVNAVHKECSSTICHRLTFMFGHPFRHEKLNVDTHNRLNEQFGPINIRILMHAEQLIDRGYLASFDYGLEKNLEEYGTEEPPSYLSKPANFKNIRIKLISGELNQLFVPVSTSLTWKWLLQQNPNGMYSRDIVKGYGHWDNFAGARANEECYPKYLDLLEECGDKA